MRAAPRSLQARLLASLLGTVVLVWLAATTATWLDLRHELDELLDSHLAQAAALLVVQADTRLGADQRRPEAPQLHRYGPKVAFQVWQGDRLALRSANAPDMPMVTTAALTNAAGRRSDSDHDKQTDKDKDKHDRDARGHGDDDDADGRNATPAGVGLGFHAARFNGADWRVFAARGAAHDVLVFVGEQQASRSDILLAVVRGMLWPLGLALPLLALAVWWAVRRGMAPLRALSRSLATRDPDALAPVQLPDAPAEMQPMLDALNRLFERIGGMVTAERRFTADAAHELRTPIAGIRMQAQVAQGATQDDERRAALAATIAGCDRATRLVEQLLQLARLEAEVTDADAREGGRGQCDLAAVAAQQAQNLQRTAQARGQHIDLQRPGQPVPVPMNGPLAAVLLRNLLDNALRYGPDGGRVAVQVAPATAGEGARLVVEDAGPGLSDADRARLGERFFRVLGSGQSGSGLGWSIVRRLARLHGLDVALDRSPTLGGLRVTVRWPAQ